MRALRLGLLLLVLGLLPEAAQAACSVSAQGLAFGTYNPFSSSNVDTTGTVTVTCTGLLGLLVGYDIYLSAGGAGSYAPRKMSAGSYQMNYNLYTDAARTAVWGGNSSMNHKSDGYLLSIGTVVRNYTVYGRIPGGQNAGAGSYADTIVVTLDY